MAFSSLIPRCPFGLYQYLRPIKRLIWFALTVTYIFAELALCNPRYDGAKLEPSYQAPKASSHVAKDDGEGDVEVYEGCCHCGAVTYTLKTKSLNQAEVTFCNCSICGRVCVPFLVAEIAAYVSRTATYGSTQIRTRSHSMGKRISNLIFSDQKPSPTISVVSVGSRCPKA